MGATATENSMKNSYPWTNMNFLVTVDGIDATAAFSEASGMEASVDVITFRQGNSGSFSQIKVPGLVKHSEVTLKYGYTESNTFRDWAMACTADRRAAMMSRHDVKIELLDITNGMDGSNTITKGKSSNQYILRDAWISKYSAPEMNANDSGIAIESVEIAFERLELPGANKESAAASET